MMYKFCKINFKKFIGLSLMFVLLVLAFGYDHKPISAANLLPLCDEYGCNIEPPPPPPSAPAYTSCSDGATICGQVVDYTISASCVGPWQNGSSPGQSCDSSASFPSGAFTDGIYNARVFGGTAIASMSNPDDNGNATLYNPFWQHYYWGCDCSSSKCGGHAGGTSGETAYGIAEGAILTVEAVNACATSGWGQWYGGAASATMRETQCIADALNATPSHAGSYVPSSAGACTFVPPTPPACAITTSLTCSGASNTTSRTLTWVTSNCTSATITGTDSSSLNATPYLPNGNYTSAVHNVTYTLSATNGTNTVTSVAQCPAYVRLAATWAENGTANLTKPVSSGAANPNINIDKTSDSDPGTVVTGIFCNAAPGSSFPVSGSASVACPTTAP